MTSIAQTSTTISMGSGRGIKTAPASDNGITVTVRKSDLTEATHFPDGFIPRLTWFIDDTGNPGYVKPATNAPNTGDKVYCLVSDTDVPDNGSTIGLGCWFTGVGFYESAVTIGANDRDVAEAQGFSFHTF